MEDFQSQVIVVTGRQPWHCCSEPQPDSSVGRGEMVEEGCLKMLTVSPPVQKHDS